MIIFAIVAVVLCLMLVLCIGYRVGIKKSLEGTTIPLFLLNTQGRVVYRNSASNNLIVPTMIIDGVHYVCSDLAVYLKSIKQQDIFCYKYKDQKTEKEFSFEGRKVWFNTQYHWIVSVRRQVDKASAEANLKQSKMIIHQIFQTFPDAVGMMNDELVYEACNLAFVKALGLNAPDQLIGKRLDQVASKEVADKFAYSDNKVLDTGEEFHVIDEITDDEGQKLWMEARKVAYKDPVTLKRGLFIFARDITEKESAKEKLNLANNEFKRLSLLDSLTGVGNRRYFEQSLTNEWKQHQITGFPLTLIKCDIDAFDVLCEQYGEPAGNKALQEVTKALQTALLRVEDMVYRFSQEQFALILSNTNAESADVVAKRIHQQVATLQIPNSVSPSKPQLTVSIGVYTCLPKVNSYERVALDEVNSALLKAKGSGSERTYHAA